MEQQPNPEDNQEAKPAKLSRRASEFFRAWLERRSTPLEDSEIEHEKTVERKEKKTRRQRLLDMMGQLFRRQVDRPEPVTEAAEPPEPAREEVARPIIPDVAVEEPIPEQPAEMVDDRLPEAAVAEPAEETVEADSVATTAARTPSPDTIAAAEHVMAPFRTAEASTTPSRPVERVVESSRGAAAVGVLLGAEYIGRKRADRKQRRDFDKKLKRERKTTQTEVRKVEADAQSTKEEVRAVARQQKAFETRPQPSRAPAAKLEKTPQQTVIFDRKAAAAEGPPPVPPPIMENLPAAQRLAQQIEALKHPAAVLEKVEQAAEKQMPLEAAYERRHETKDQQPTGTGGSSGGRATSLAQALRERVARSEAAAVAAEYANTAPGTPELYKQAVKSGVTGGAVILIFIAILAVIARG
jgi:hypothetical protein